MIHIRGHKCDKNINDPLALEVVVSHFYHVMMSNSISITKMLFICYLHDIYLPIMTLGVDFDV